MSRALLLLGVVLGLVVLGGVGFLLVDPGEPDLDVNGRARPERRPADARPPPAARPVAPTPPPAPEGPGVDGEMARLREAWAKAVDYLTEGEPVAALTLLAPFRKTHPDFFEDAERAALLGQMEYNALVCLDVVIDIGTPLDARKFARTLEGVILDPGRLDVLQGRMTQVGREVAAESRRVENGVIARTRKGQDKKALVEHIQRFGSTRKGSRGKTILDRRLAELAKQKSPAELTLPVPDPEEVEKRRLEQLEKLRQRNAIGLLDNIAAGLAWLALHQAPDGRISESTVAARCKVLHHDPRCKVGKERWPVASTSLAVIAFLDFRDQDTKGLFEPALTRAVNWLLKQQGKDGNFPPRLYSHSIALMALGQAAASTNREDIRVSVKRGLAYMARKPGPVGGFRYQPGMPGDLSVSGWVTQALEAAETGGIEIPPELPEGLRAFWSTVWRGESRFAYLPTRGDSRTLVPVGMLMGKILKHPSVTTQVTNGWRKTLTTQKWRPNLYGLYYGIRVLLALDGKLPKQWNTWTDQVAKAQTTKGSAAGSFPVKGNLARWFSETTTYTAYCVLTLEHCLYRR
jgi:hypothetical protein